MTFSDKYGFFCSSIVPSPSLSLTYYGGTHYSTLERNRNVFSSCFFPLSPTKVSPGALVPVYSTQKCRVRLPLPSAIRTEKLYASLCSFLPYWYCTHNIPSYSGDANELSLRKEKKLIELCTRQNRCCEYVSTTNCFTYMKWKKNRSSFWLLST